MVEEIAKKYVGLFETQYDGNEISMDKGLDSLSKKYNVDKDELQKAMRKMIKERKYNDSQKGKIKFFHSTSVSAAEKIIEDGALMSFKEREKRGKDVSNPRANTKMHGVEFTNDNYTKTGELYSTGYKEGRGAVSADVTFVFGDELLQDENFDAFGLYPTIDYVGLDKCLAVICDNENNKKIIKESLAKNGLNNIIVYTEDNFNVAETSSSLKRKKELNSLFCPVEVIRDTPQNAK